MARTRLLFVINQFFKGGAEIALLNLLKSLSSEKCEIDLVIFDQINEKNAISLQKELPNWINVQEYWRGSGRKLWSKMRGRACWDKQLLRSLEQREYEAVISWGEWFSCELAAIKVKAQRRYLWIHSDMEKAGFISPDILRYWPKFDKIVFVSEFSRQGALQQYPFLRERSLVVHNLVDKAGLLTMAAEPVETPYIDDDLPFVVTAANVRPEKNHLRQVEVMRILAEKNICFHWLNIGSLANEAQTAKVRQVVKQAGLEKYFHFLGALDNPYKYMKRAAAVCVLSDHESWSMVISEAKALGVPVVATKTSGALEQIENNVNGLLCDFDAQAIAEQLERLLTDVELQQRLHTNVVEAKVSDFRTERLLLNVEPAPKQVLWIFDDINYKSGARTAALAQAKVLKKYAQTVVFSGEPCRDKDINEEYAVFDLRQLQPGECFNALNQSGWQVLADPAYSFKAKLWRVLYFLAARLGKADLVYRALFSRDLVRFWDYFDAVCVVSEASKFREQAARLSRSRRVQWIHTDYAAWRQYSDWARTITRNDAGLYKKYDQIVCLSERLREGFVSLYPELAAKTVTVGNLIEDVRIREMAAFDCVVNIDERKFNIVTIGRLEPEKHYGKLLEAVECLRQRGLQFHWYFVGGGALQAELEALSSHKDLAHFVSFTGHLVNPYPLFAACDVLVIFSEYEGTPVTVDEAKVLGVPVISANVGGVSDQLEQGKYGQIVNNFTELVGALATAIENRGVSMARFAAADCQKYNEKVLQELLRTLF